MSWTMPYRYFKELKFIQSWSWLFRNILNGGRSYVTTLQVSNSISLSLPRLKEKLYKVEIRSSSNLKSPHLFVGVRWRNSWVTKFVKHLVLKHYAAAADKEKPPMEKWSRNYSTHNTHIEGEGERGMWGSSMLPSLTILSWISALFLSALILSPLILFCFQISPSYPRDKARIPWFFK